MLKWSGKLAKKVYNYFCRFYFSKKFFCKKFNSSNGPLAKNEKKIVLSGVLVSYVDIVFITQSVNLKTNVARFLYLTPPTMCIPMAYVTTREVLEHTVGDKLWTYTAAALPGAAIWGVFRKYLFLSGLALEGDGG